MKTLNNKLYCCRWQLSKAQVCVIPPILSLCIALGLSLGYNSLTLAEEDEDESPYLTNVLEESYPIDNKYRLCVYSGGEEVVIKINKRCPQVNR